MAIKYVKDFEFPASGGFHGDVQRYAKGGYVTKMPSKAAVSAKGMPARATPNAPARGAARMESKPKMGKGQGYAKGGSVKKTPPKTAIAIGRPGSVAKPSPKSVSKSGLGPVMAPTSITSPKSVSKPASEFLGPVMAPTQVTYSKSSYGKPKMEAYAKGGRVAPTQPLAPSVPSKSNVASTVLSRYKRMAQAAKSNAPKSAPKPAMPLPGFAKGGQMTAQERRALDKMRHAEKYAPGLSLDMPGKRVKKTK